MEAKEEIRMRDNTAKRMKDFPPSMVEFINLQYNSNSVATTYEYAKDLDLLLTFIKKHYKEKDPSDFLVSNIPLDVYQMFIEYIKNHEVTYISTANTKVTQRFKNSNAGVNRKISTLMKWTSFLEQEEFTQNEIYKHLELIEEEEESKTIYTGLKTVRTLLTVIDEGIGIETWQAAQYHEKNKERDTAIILLITLSGLKIGECLSIKLKDLHLDKNIIHISRRGARESEVTVPDECLQALTNYIVKAFGEDVDFRIDSEGMADILLFRSLHEESLHPKTVMQSINKYVERAGIKIDVTPQTLRRTAEVLLLNAFESENAVEWAVGRKHDKIENKLPFRNKWRLISIQTKKA